MQSEIMPTTYIYIKIFLAWDGFEYTFSFASAIFLFPNTVPDPYRRAARRGDDLLLLVGD